jgi:hypothetical protein
MVIIKLELLALGFGARMFITRRARKPMCFAAFGTDISECRKIFSSSKVCVLLPKPVRAGHLLDLILKKLSNQPEILALFHKFQRWSQQP